MRSSCISLVMALLVSAGASAQVATGTPPFGSFSGGPFDTVNQANLNVHFGIPILSKAGRGLPFHYVMDYESSFWVVSGSKWQPTNAGNWGWRAQSEALTGTVPVYATLGYCFFTDPNSGQRYKNPYPTKTYTGYSDPGGTFHPARIVTTDGSQNCDIPVNPVYTGNASATDGSGYLVTVDETSNPNVVVKTRSGVTIPGPGTGSGAMIDTNGNQLTTNVSGSTTTFTDTLGKTVLTVNVVSPSQTTYTYTAPSGDTAQFLFNYSQHSVQTNFACPRISEYPATPIYLLDSIKTPDSTQYSFQYESTPGLSGKTTGRIASVTLPTGGMISYVYQGANNGITCGDGSAVTLQRTTPDGTWTYAHSEGNPWATTLFDPQGNQTSLEFQGPYETKRIVMLKTTNGMQTLATTIACYNGNTTNCSTTPITLPISRRTTIVQLPTSSGVQSKTDILFNTLGLVTETDQYGYGSGAPGALLRKTFVGYASPGDNILDHPASVIVQDGNSNIVGETTFAYDWRGNLTTLSRYSGTQTLTSQYSYYDNGTLNVATDVNGAQTKYNYGSGSCGNSFPDSVNLPLNLTSSATYNCTGGVLTSSTDASGNTTYVNYKADKFFWRPESTQDAAGAQTGITYSGATKVESAMNFNGGSSTVDLLTTLDSLGRVQYSQQKQSPTSGNYDSTQITYDAVHALVTGTMPYLATAASPGPPTGTPVTTTNLDALGRTTQIADGGGGTTSYQYTNNDILVSTSGAQIFKKQLEYDALGRLSSVCEITAASGSGSCGQSNPAIGFLTKYTYNALGDLLTVTQNAQPGAIGGTQARSFVYDMLGRLTSETNPESGTTTYVYDSLPSFCNGETWAIPGALISVTYANGNYVCYQYDLLGRVGAATGNSGSGGAPICRRFYYDNSTGVLSARPSGVSPQNSYGRMVEAETDSCAWPVTPSSMITDEWFSYDADGRTTDTYQSSPNSGGYYHATASYLPNGAVQTLGLLNSAQSPLIPTQTYGVDGEGRPNSVTASSGQNPVTSVAYTTSGTTQPIGSLTNVTFGSGDSDSYQYDPGTGRMTQYSFNVNGQSVVGNLHWNANGTLGQLAITDPFNSQDNQTCNNTYDDLGRISGNNCGSAWQQTFSYDAFGNISKTGSISWQPGYNSNNQYTLGSTSYDASGNLLNDSFNTYTWDGYGNLATVNSATVTNDAFGRMVENASRSLEVVYPPMGGSAIAAMQGQTLGEAWVPLPGGATAAYNRNDLDMYYYADWLGSVRQLSWPNRTPLPMMAYAPFGEGYAGGTPMDVEFTAGGYSLTVLQPENQGGSLQDFMFRRYSPVQGRWISPDPSGLAAVDPTNPQSWNRYAYVNNSPLNGIDPTGLEKCKECVFMGYGGGGNCTMDGVGTPCGVVQATIQSGGASQCPNNDCRGVTLQSNGEFYRDTYSESLALNCNGADLSNYACGWSNWSKQFVQNANDDWVVGLGNDVPLGPMGQAVFGQLGKQAKAAEELIGIVYGGSVVAGTGGYVVYDLAAGASGSNLFGTAYYGSKGLLNGGAFWGSLLRIGGTFTEGTLYFGLHGGTGSNSWHLDLFEWWP